MDFYSQHKKTRSKLVKKIFCALSNNKTYSTCSSSSLNNTLLFNKKDNLFKIKKVKEAASKKEKNQILSTKSLNPLKAIDKLQKCPRNSKCVNESIQQHKNKGYFKINKEKLDLKKAYDKDKFADIIKQKRKPSSYITNLFQKSKNLVKSDLEKSCLSSNFACLMDLANESLALIFSYLQASDISSVAGVCQRLRSICQQHRAYLPMSNVDLLRVNYGKWRDILKCRALRCCRLNKILNVLIKKI